jgi:glycosyltransferase involved in cell wall biosynthesis
MVEIEILLLAYNREALIGATLESLLKQTVPAIRICVLDNGSTDRTAEIVKSFASRGVELFHRPTNDPRACWSDLQRMARGPWTIIFHDDDLLHPCYIEHASSAIRLMPEASVIVSGMQASQNPSEKNWGNADSVRAHKLTARELAARLYAGFAMPFCSAVYRTDILKQVELPIAIYGKIFDRPLVLQMAGMAFALLLPYPYVRYRLHGQQDSCDMKSGPYLDQMLALQRLYLELLGDSPWTSSGRIFLRRSLRNLLCDFRRLGLVGGIDERNLLKRALEEGATSNRAIRIGKIYRLLTELPRRAERTLKGWFVKSVRTPK